MGIGDKFLGFFGITLDKKLPDFTEPETKPDKAAAEAARRLAKREKELFNRLPPDDQTRVTLMKRIAKRSLTREEAIAEISHHPQLGGHFVLGARPKYLGLNPDRIPQKKQPGSKTAPPPKPMSTELRTYLEDKEIGVATWKFAEVQPPVEEVAPTPPPEPGKLIGERGQDEVLFDSGAIGSAPPAVGYPMTPDERGEMERQAMEKLEATDAAHGEESKPAELIAPPAEKPAKKVKKPAPAPAEPLPTIADLEEPTAPATRPVTPPPSRRIPPGMGERPRAGARPVDRPAARRETLLPGVKKALERRATAPIPEPPAEKLSLSERAERLATELLTRFEGANLNTATLRAELFIAPKLDDFELGKATLRELVKQLAARDNFSLIEQVTDAFPTNDLNQRDLFITETLAILVHRVADTSSIPDLDLFTRLIEQIRSRDLKKLARAGLADLKKAVTAGGSPAAEVAVAPAVSEKVADAGEAGAAIARGSEDEAGDEFPPEPIIVPEIPPEITLPREWENFLSALVDPTPGEIKFLMTHSGFTREMLNSDPALLDAVRKRLEQMRTGGANILSADELLAALPQQQAPETPTAKAAAAPSGDEDKIDWAAVGAAVGLASDETAPTETGGPAEFRILPPEEETPEPTAATGRAESAAVVGARLAEELTARQQAREEEALVGQAGAAVRARQEALPSVDKLHTQFTEGTLSTDQLRDLLFASSADEGQIKKGLATVHTLIGLSVADLDLATAEKLLDVYPAGRADLALTNISTLVGKTDEYKAVIADLPRDLKLRLLDRIPEGILKDGFRAKFFEKEEEDRRAAAGKAGLEVFVGVAVDARHAAKVAAAEEGESEPPPAATAPVPSPAPAPEPAPAAPAAREPTPPTEPAAPDAAPTVGKERAPATPEEDEVAPPGNRADQPEPKPTVITPIVRRRKTIAPPAEGGGQPVLTIGADGLAKAEGRGSRGERRGRGEERGGAGRGRDRDRGGERPRDDRGGPRRERPAPKERAVADVTLNGIKTGTFDIKNDYYVTIDGQEIDLHIPGFKRATVHVRADGGEFTIKFDDDNFLTVGNRGETPEISKIFIELVANGDRKKFRRGFTEFSKDPSDPMVVAKKIREAVERDIEILIKEIKNQQFAFLEYADEEERQKIVGRREMAKKAARRGEKHQSKSEKEIPATPFVVRNELLMLPMRTGERRGETPLAVNLYVRGLPPAKVEQSDTSLVISYADGSRCAFDWNADLSKINATATTEGVENKLQIHPNPIIQGESETSTLGHYDIPELGQKISLLDRTVPATSQEKFPEELRATRVRSIEQPTPFDNVFFTIEKFVEHARQSQEPSLTTKPHEAADDRFWGQLSETLQKSLAAERQTQEAAEQQTEESFLQKIEELKEKPDELTAYLLTEAPFEVTQTKGLIRLARRDARKVRQEKVHGEDGTSQNVETLTLSAVSQGLRTKFSDSEWRDFLKEVVPTAEDYGKTRRDQGLALVEKLGTSPTAAVELKDFVDSLNTNTQETVLTKLATRLKEAIPRIPPADYKTIAALARLLPESAKEKKFAIFDALETQPALAKDLPAAAEILYGVRNRGKQKELIKAVLTAGKDDPAVQTGLGTLLAPILYSSRLSDLKFMEEVTADIKGYAPELAPKVEELVTRAAAHEKITKDVLADVGEIVEDLSNALDRKNKHGLARASVDLSSLLLKTPNSILSEIKRKYGRRFADMLDADEGKFKEYFIDALRILKTVPLPPREERADDEAGRGGRGGGRGKKAGGDEAASPSGEAKAAPVEPTPGAPAAAAAAPSEVEGQPEPATGAGDEEKKPE